jgi:hypothetical protein
MNRACNLILALGAALAALAAAAGCNAARTGSQQHLSFTPSSCGLLAGCDFADTLAVLGTVDVGLTSLDGTPTAGLTLAALTPGGLDVTGLASGTGIPAWRLTGIGPGTTTLAAIDSGGTEIDSIAVTTQDATGLGLIKFAGQAVGPTAESGYDEAWTVLADQAVALQAVALVDGQPIMGRLAFDVVADDAGLLATEISGSDHAYGYLYVQPPAGDYPLTLDVSGTTALRLTVMIHAAATLP